ncbi:EamA family transporter [Labedaea rhizosphaerae]|uniref:Putative blue pigment (Indigoidine) exporter n=1 Tax=Labedaea rhizosphaerae TaxID=598644 RepID=A0A4R6RQ96_LABRH|nr:EamA family transporter [Labedaea rhizosphaerae]TDP88890.1 putative blue pigment (indigoidine) exporter [Labedaea rhizosphaerae]
MEAGLRWTLITAIAPIAWGTNYYVTREFLPAGHALYGGALRAVPAGLLLLAVRRQLPKRDWWWKALVLGVLNVGAFFALIYLAAQLLPTSIASVVMALSPVALMLMAWALASERPRLLPLGGAVLGIVGVGLMMLSGQTTVNPAGLLASVAALALSSLGYVLAKRWGGGVDLIASTSWQLLAGGLVLLPVAVAVEGAPPALDAKNLLGFGYVVVVATALAFVAWFTGLRHLPAGTVGLVGLLNPVTGVLLGAGLAGESLTLRQIGGLALVLGGLLLSQISASRGLPPLRRREKLAPPGRWQGQDAGPAEAAPQAP